MSLNEVSEIYNWDKANINKYEIPHAKAEIPRHTRNFNGFFITGRAEMLMHDKMPSVAKQTGIAPPMVVIGNMAHATINIHIHQGVFLKSSFVIFLIFALFLNICSSSPSVLVIVTKTSFSIIFLSFFCFLSNKTKSYSCHNNSGKKTNQ